VINRRKRKKKVVNVTNHNLIADGATMPKPPKRFQKFTEHYPDVTRAYEELGTAVHAAGPLDPKTRALVKLAISTGARLEGAVHSHVRKALEAGVKPAELRHVALLALPTIGLPSMMAALSWIDDVLDASLEKRRK
jgi:alkylhydroperoxidase/carboxymuconolactone decarboxylase family protein YurZ